MCGVGSLWRRLRRLSGSAVANHEGLQAQDLRPAGVANGLAWRHWHPMSSRAGDLASVGTRSAWAIRTVASEPPFVSESGAYRSASGRRNAGQLPPARDAGWARPRPGPWSGALVVGECVCGDTSQPAEGGIERGEHRPQGSVPGRQYHSVAAPRQPSAEQVGWPAPDQWALAPVVLKPHTGLGDPGPIDPVPASLVRGLDLCHRPACRPLVACKSHGDQAVVDNVGADLAARALHQLLDLPQERVDEVRAPPWL